MRRIFNTPIDNATPTSEGALQIAMEELPITLHESSCMVIGYGRIGRYLSYCLKALGANVTVSARRLSDLAWASAFGYTGIKTSEIKNNCKNLDVIFNTVPSQVLTSEELSVLPEGCLCIDLASKPGGINFEAAQELGVKVIWALSLPGKVAPFTSGKIIKNAVYNILDELEAKDI